MLELTSTALVCGLPKLIKDLLQLLALPKLKSSILPQCLPVIAARRKAVLDMTACAECIHNDKLSVKLDQQQQGDAEYGHGACC